MMDEDHYQAYRLAVLTQWIERSVYFEYSGEYICQQCEEAFKEIDDCISHLQVHYPDFFY